MGDIDPFTPAVELAAAVRRKDVSPVELADLYLARIDEHNGLLNAFCHRADDEVRAAAKVAADAVVAAEDLASLPAFHGVPIPIKDLNDVAGWPTTWGSRGASDAPATTSDPVVQRFVDAGFVLLGKTTTPEFGTISFTESDALGITRNPWNPEHTPGGSSGGAGAAVAAGLAPIAHGSDGGGSIRIPSSCNGLVGLKPTRGRIANTHVDLEGLATNGVLARTVADLAAGLDVLSKHDPAAWWSAPTPTAALADALAEEPPEGLRIAVMHHAPADLVAVDPACASAVDVAVLALSAAGHHPETTLPEMPSPDELVSAFGVIWNVGAAGVPLADPAAVEPLNRAIREAAGTVDSFGYAEAVIQTQALSRRIVESFVAGFDLLVTPTMACLPPAVGAWREGMDLDPMMGLINCFPMGIFTSIFNVTGLPAISVPVHHDDATGLPVGVQIVAAPWREDLLLQVAAHLERALPWKDRRPPGF
jgi:amidase